MTKLIVAFRNIVRAHKNIRYNFCCVKFSPHACQTHFVRYLELQTNKQMDQQFYCPKQASCFDFLVKSSSDTDINKKIYIYNILSESIIVLEG